MHIVRVSRVFCFQLLLLTGIGLSDAAARELFVSPAGNDNHSGTHAAPLATLDRARQIARKSAGAEDVTIHVADGVYYLPETLVFEPGDSGTADHPVTYVATNEGQAVLSGGARLELAWTPYRDGIFQAKTPAGLTIDQLFVNGRNQRMARYPNFDAARTTDPYQGYAADAFSSERAASWDDPRGGYIHALHRARWGGYHYQITGKTPEGEVEYVGGWQNNRRMGMHRDFRMVENIFEELDAPGEWYHDQDTSTVYFMPPADCDLDKAVVEVVRLKHLIEFQGTEQAPVTHITLKGFCFRHAARTFMETREPMLRSDWAIYRGGAVFLTGTEDVRLLDTEFDQVGGNAVFASNYNRGLQIRGCHIHDAGASGVCIVGDPEAVRDPLFEYGQKNDLATIDRTPGPKTNNYPADCVVADCLIHGIGRVERQPAGVHIDMSQNIVVQDCSIYDCARAGINIGDGAWGGHLIERCDVFDTVQETHDHGSFNSWGRDRYWRRDHLEASQKAVDDDPSLPFLDAMETTVIRNSRWRCDHGWDIDLDDGSSNYDIYNNLMLAGGLKLREGFRRRAWNNITVNNGLHPHVWFANSGDEVFSNIFMALPRGVRTPNELASGKRIDSNLYFLPENTENRYAKFGWDLNSHFADPQFVDPAAGDFRVKSGSPAFDIGFENFPMDQFGVKKPSLKAIAETPIIPPPKRKESTPALNTPASLATYWLGAKLQELAGEDYSAFGIAKEQGGVALVEVPEDSAAAGSGLVSGDVIQRVNGRPVRSEQDLIQSFCSLSDNRFPIALVRNQQTLTLEITPEMFIVTESAGSPEGFRQLVPTSAQEVRVSANQSVSNAPVEELTDGQLSEGYGPVFPNSVSTGAYRIDLGEAKAVSAVTSWTTDKNGNRGPQRFTIYGSASKNAGWDVEDRTKFTPLGSIDTTHLSADKFNAVSLRASEAGDLGTFRVIVIRVAPITGKGENSAFQEFAVE